MDPNCISSEFARNSGAYIAWARAGNAWNRPGISARSRYEMLCLPRPSVRAKNATRSSRNSTYAAQIIAVVTAADLDRLEASRLEILENQVLVIILAVDLELDFDQLAAR